MVTIPQQIIYKFLEKLESSDKIKADQLEHLRKLLTSNKKFKADDLVKIFSSQTDGGIK